MLRELHISNLAVIEDARVELAGGFNCFTGQTGAGKSLIIGAFEILLGLRPAADMLRPGAEEGRVTGLFELRDPDVAGQVGGGLDLTLAAGDELLITRKLFASGRSSLSANGQPVTAPMVRAVGQLLVDIHGQHDHQYLLQPSNQLTILDSFGRSTDLCQRFAQLQGQRRRLRRRQKELRASRTLRRQQRELYEFQSREIDDADPVAGEFDKLKSRHTLLSNVQRLQREAGQAHAALYEADGSIVERLQVLTHLLLELAEVDANLAELAQQVRTATLSLQEGAFELNRYVDRLDVEPGELAQVEDRLNVVNRLIAKYAPRSGGDDPVAEVLAYRDRLGRQIEQLRGDDADLEQIGEQIAESDAELAAVGRELSEARRAAAKRLKPLVETELHELGMADAEFDVAFEQADSSERDGDDDGADIGGDDDVDEAEARVAGDSPSGAQSIEMLVRTNPGQPARPLRKIASGGEMSRIMLALKSILAQSDRVSVLVFDEIDANVGGRMGTVIGQKLRSLAGRGGQQVLCITHLPQIAAMADRHLRITKTSAGRGKAGRTATTVTPLQGKARIEELAEMLAGGGVTPTTRKQVRELLATAQSAVAP